MPDTSHRPKLRKTASRYRSKIQGTIEKSVRRVRYMVNWNFLRNPASRRRFRAHPPHLTPLQREAVEALRARGIAFVSQDQLGIDPADWENLLSMAREFAASDRLAARVREFATLAEERPLVGDDYMVKLYPEGPTIDPSNPILRIGTCDAVLDVVNGYLGMWAKLVYLDMWHTIPVDIGRRVGSQNWHRDPEDRRMIKAYLYCADVDAGAGPMEYIPGTALGGPYAHLWSWKPKATHAERYPSDEAITKRLPDAERIKCTGRRGTLVLCDTSGLHRGGISRTSSRLLATWTFVTPAALGSTVYRRFRVASGAFMPLLSAAATAALI
jgi:phytanoyl-CoA dioxygenase PhyH